MIQPGQPLPGTTLYEFFEVEKNDCVLGLNAFSIQHLAKGKMVIILELPSVFTSTCSARHVSGHLANYDVLYAKDADEI